jgi:thermostable 8-oxoguanine DNA glycosylase
MSNRLKGLLRKELIVCVCAGVWQNDNKQTAATTVGASFCGSRSKNELQKSIRKYRFFGHAHVTGIEILYIFHSSQKLLPTHFAWV